MTIKKIVSIIIKTISKCINARNKTTKSKRIKLDNKSNHRSFNTPYYKI